MQPPSPYTEILNQSSAKKTQRLIVLGASGSVGGSCMDFLERDGTIEPVAVSVHTSVSKINLWLSKFKIKHICITQKTCYEKNIDTLKKEHIGVSFYCGQKGLLEMIQVSCEKEKADTVLTAVVGAVGIEATMLSLNLGLKIALANKETMVTAGPAIRELIQKKKNLGHKLPVILPVDSEHNAVFQLIAGLHESHLSQVVLTASGGPFRDLPVDQLKYVKHEEVLNHPTWSMGPKITVDSAGMINKGLEIIEAHFLFSLPYEKLDAVIHPDSLIHAMAMTTDGAYLMCGSQPHMVFPIAHSLYYPQALPFKHPISTTPDTWPPLQFKKVEKEKYRGFGVALEAGIRGGTAPAIFNACNEVCVDLFLKGSLRFLQIPELIERVLEKSTIQDTVLLPDFLEADKQARILALQMSKTLS